MVPPPISGTAGTVTNGTFALSAQATATVTDAAAQLVSIYKVWNISFTPTLASGPDAPVILVTPGAGSFDVATQDGVAATGTWGYTIYNN